MSSITLPHFGTLHPNSLDGYYDTETIIAGNDVRLDLNFSEKTIPLSRLSAIKKYLDRLEYHLLKVKKYIYDNYHDEESEDGVRFYFNFHKDEMGEDGLVEQLEINTIDEVDDQLLDKLQLVRIGFYPDSHDFAIFEYSFGEDLTNYIVVVSTDEDAELNSVTVES